MDIAKTVLQSYRPSSLPKNMRAESYLAVRVCTWNVNNMFDVTRVSLRLAGVPAVLRLHGCHVGLVERSFAASVMLSFQ